MSNTVDELNGVSVIEKVLGCSNSASYAEIEAYFKETAISVSIIRNSTTFRGIEVEAPSVEILILHLLSIDVYVFVSSDDDTGLEYLRGLGLELDMTALKEVVSLDDIFLNKNCVARLFADVASTPVMIEDFLNFDFIRCALSFSNTDNNCELVLDGLSDDFTPVLLTGEVLATKNLKTIVAISDSLAKSSGVLVPDLDLSIDNSKSVSDETPYIQVGGVADLSIYTEINKGFNIEDERFYVVALVYDGKLVGYRFVGKTRKYDISLSVASILGLSSFKVNKKVTLKEHNGLLVSDGEIRSKKVVKDISHDIDFIRELMDSVLSL